MFNFIARVLSCLNCNKLRKTIADRDAVIQICADALKEKDAQIVSLGIEIMNVNEHVQALYTELDEKGDKIDRDANTISGLRSAHQKHTSELLDAGAENDRLKRDLGDMTRLRDAIIEDFKTLANKTNTSYLGSDIDQLEAESQVW
jgi:hypothetical protein